MWLVLRLSYDDDRGMGHWPDGAASREQVEQALASPLHWHVRWCEGSGRPDTHGFGRVLPAGLLDKIPGRVKRRKIERGLHGYRTWVFAFLSERGPKRELFLHEGPVDADYLRDIGVVTPRPRT